VIPQRIEELPSDVIDFLAYHGYTQEDIQKAFDNRPKSSEQPKREIPKRTPKMSALCELESLIGLDVVKTKVKEIATFIERRGKKNANVCFHMCFRGNPGVGKTTVARIIARKFYEAGVIKKNLLVETDRGGLCGQYVGETAIKTDKIIQSAMGGVLFIDEAYALFSDSEKDFGNEAVATLVKQMEDKRDQFVCILAGYTKEMDTMLDMNPGLTDRIQFYIDFPDYNEHELLQIFEKFCLDNTYELSKSARDTLVSEFSRVIAEKSRNFSNGRYARKIFERVMMKQSLRTCDDTITDEDIKEVFAEPDV
jgi:AAA+ superfamily predicted ATPase